MMISVDHDISALLRINVVQFLIQFGVPCILYRTAAILLFQLSGTTF